MNHETSLGIGLGLVSSQLSSYLLQWSSSNGVTRWSSAKCLKCQTTRSELDYSGASKCVSATGLPGKADRGGSFTATALSSATSEFSFFFLMSKFSISFLLPEQQGPWLDISSECTILNRSWFVPGITDIISTIHHFFPYHLSLPSVLINCPVHQAGEFELMEDGNGTMMDYQVSFPSISLAHN